MIVRVNVVLKRTVVVDNDWRFSNLAVVIFRVKVSFITSVDGINYWSIYSPCCWSVSYTVLYLNPVRPKNVWPLNILSGAHRHLRRRSFSHTHPRRPRCGRKGATKVFKYRPKRQALGTDSVTRPFPNGQANAGSWLGTKKSFAGIIAPNRPTVSPELFSCVRTRRLFFRHTCKEMHAVRKLSVW